MTIKQRAGFNINLILAKLSKLRTLNSDGSFSFKGFNLSHYESILRTCVDAEGKSDAFVRSIVAKAMHQEQDLTADKFIKHCNRIANLETHRNLKTFKVVFPIWGSNNLLVGRRKWDNVTIAFGIGRKSPFARLALRERADQIKKCERPELKHDFTDLPLAVCTVKAIHLHDAFEQAESAISKELGLYSLVSGRGKYLFAKWPDTPINTVLLAPHMTVHETTGAMSADVFWYNSWPTRMNEKSLSPAEIKKMQNWANRVKTQLRKLPWRRDAELALARHYSAFSQCDLEASFLDGWRLLESIGGNSREKSEILVKRAAWFFEERDENYQIGLHLMIRRNLISHGRPVKGENNEQLAFQMKTFLRPFLNFYLSNPFNFRSIDELWSFCDLPADRSTRIKHLKLLNYAAKFMGEK